MKFILLSEAFAVLTFGLGWWTVPIVAVLWSLVTHAPHRAGFAALCAASGWASLLALHASRGSISSVAAQIGGVMTIPPIALYALTLLFPALLAWSAATLAPNLRRR